MTAKAQLAFAFLGSAALIGTALAAPVAQGGQKFSMILTDEAEVPGPGDPNATGTAIISINPGQERICWEITTSNVNPAFIETAGTGAHIHPGAAGTANPPIVHLSLELNGTATGCTNVSRTLINQILANPQNYYVNLHWKHPTDPTLDFSAGALRAQLTKAPRRTIR